LRSLFPNTRIIMVESNHDKRLQKYLNSQASELSVLDCLNLKELMGLDTFNIEYKKFFIFKKVLFKHGNIVRQHSGYTARAEMLKEGTSGSSGHTHRLGSHYKTLRGGKYVWVEGGCLCDPKKAEYIEGTANWQQGVTGFDFPKGSKRFYPFIIPIIDSKAIFAKKLYK